MCLFIYLSAAGAELAGARGSALWGEREAGRGRRREKEVMRKRRNATRERLQSRGGADQHQLPRQHTSRPGHSGAGRRPPRGRQTERGRYVSTDIKVAL